MKRCYVRLITTVITNVLLVFPLILKLILTIAEPTTPLDLTHKLNVSPSVTVTLVLTRESTN